MRRFALLTLFILFVTAVPGALAPTPAEWVPVSTAMAHEDEPEDSTVTEPNDTQPESHNEVVQPEGILPGLQAKDSVHAPLTKFPVGLLPTAWFLVVASYWVRPKFFLRAGELVYWLGLVSMLPAAVSGFHNVGGWGHGHAESHRNLMLISVLLALGLGALLALCRNQEESTRRHLLAAGLTLVVTVLLVGADYGGWLVYELGHGVSTGP